MADFKLLSTWKLNSLLRSWGGPFQRTDNSRVWYLLGQVSSPSHVSRALLCEKKNISKNLCWGNVNRNLGASAVKSGYWYLTRLLWKINNVHGGLDKPSIWFPSICCHEQLFMIEQHTYKTQNTNPSMLLSGMHWLPGMEVGRLTGRVRGTFPGWWTYSFYWEGCGLLGGVFWSKLI